MTWLTHFLAFVGGVWGGIIFSLWAVDMVPDTISRILKQNPKG